MKYPAAALLLAAALAPPPAPAAGSGGEWLLSLEQGHEALDGGRPEWRSSAVGAAWSGETGSARAEWREVSRFGVSDRQWSASATGRQQDVTLTVEFSGSPDHDLLPEYAAGFDLGAAVGRGWVLSAGARRNAYAEEDATVFRGAIEHYAGATRLAYTAVNGRLESGDSGTTHVVQGDWYYAAASRAGVVLAAGGEATRTGPGTVIVADVRSVALVGRHWLRGPWGLSWSLGWTEQGDFYTRRGGVLGLLYRL